MVKKVQYSFNFDFNIKLLEKFYKNSVPNAYKEIETWMKKHHVEHRQGSGYNTINKITEFQLVELITNLNKEKSWVFKCLKVFDYYEIGRRKEAKQLLETITNPIEIS